jgi:hypothetical protein
MNPYEKALELANKMYLDSALDKSKSEHLLELKKAQQRAIICVHEILNDNPNIYDSDRLNHKYWKSVRKEIMNLIKDI